MDKGKRGAPAPHGAITVSEKHDFSLPVRPAVVRLGVNVR